MDLVSDGGSIGIADTGLRRSGFLPANLLLAIFCLIFSPVGGIHVNEDDGEEELVAKVKLLKGTKSFDLPRRIFFRCPDSAVHSCPSARTSQPSFTRFVSALTGNVRKLAETGRTSSKSSFRINPTTD